MPTSQNVTWNKNTTYALGLYRLIINSLGIWPLKGHTLFSKIRLSFVIFSQIVMAIALLSEINLDCSEVSDIIQMLSLAVCNVLTLTKIIFLYLYQNKMFDIISSAVEDWQLTTDTNILLIMRKNAKLGRFVCIFQMISAYLTVFVIVLGTLPFLVPLTDELTNTTITMHRPLPLRTVCFYGEMPTFIYLSVYVFQVIQLLVTCTINVGGDCYFFGITLHVTSQFEHLAYEYTNICTNTGTGTVNCEKNLAILIAKHNRYLNFANYLEETFNFIILLQLSVNMVQLSLTGVQMIVSLQIGDVATVINGVVIYYVINLQMFLYSYASDRLSTEIENLRNAVYCSSWYDLPPKINKSIKFIMLKANKTFNITAGKIFYMNIASFKNIVKATFSYFSFLRVMID